MGDPMPYELWMQCAKILTTLAQRKGYPKWLRLISQSEKGILPSWAIWGCCFCDYQDQVSLTTVFSFQKRYQLHGIQHLKEHGLMIFV